MLKFGLTFLFGTFSHIIITLVLYQFYFRYAMTAGGVGGTITSNIHPFIGIIILLELVISVSLIISGLIEKNR